MSEKPKTKCGFCGSAIWVVTETLTDNSGQSFEVTSCGHCGAAFNALPVSKSSGVSPQGTFT